MREPFPDWILPEWPASHRVRAMVTTRNGGLGAGPYATMNLAAHVGDDPATVRRNRALLCGYLPAEPKWLQQVHGSRVVQADGLDTVPDADASVARTPGTVCAVMIADCLPVLFCDDAGSVVAAAHAGWRGLAAGVLEHTVAAMGVPGANLHAWLGPAIGPTAFEVGADVRDAFLAHDPGTKSAFAVHKHDKWLADLFALARLRLRHAGVGAIHGGDLCTYTDPGRFFSHRRDRVSGRMAALIWLAEPPSGGPGA